MDSSKTAPSVSVAEIRRAVEQLTIAQAQIGFAVIELLADPNELTPQVRDQMRVKVEQTVNDLMNIARKLLEAPDGG